MMASDTFGYDRAITIFAPDGRLYQVEYANEAVRRGTPAIGVKSKEGVILVVQKKATSKLEDISYLHKIFKVDEHVGVAISGLHADGRRLVDYARLVAQWNRLTYDEKISIKSLTKTICDLEQYYTQHAFARPFGVALLIAGFDDTGPQLYSTGASGSYWGWMATSIGSGSENAQEYLQKNYKKDLTLEEAWILGFKALEAATKEALTMETVEAAQIDAKTKMFRELTKDEIKKYLKQIQKEKESEE
ncbi:MAG: archaeal proteasome endopeptidase complex subunit alpha [Candidatus Asgardarchaeia archaeon]